MKIVSAKYLKDPDGNPTLVVITDDKGVTCTAPAEGSTWVNTELTQWQAAGGVIQPADQ